MGVPDGAREALAAAELVRSKGRSTPESCPHCPPQAHVCHHEEELRSWGDLRDVTYTNEQAADRALAALSAAGYKVTKATPTLADLAAEQDAHPLVDVSSLAAADPLTEEESKVFLGALRSCRSEKTWTEYGIRMVTGAVREGLPSRAAAVSAWEAGSMADTIVQREVSAGPWVPVSGEEQP